MTANRLESEILKWNSERETNGSRLENIFRIVEEKWYFGQPWNINQDALVIIRVCVQYQYMEDAPTVSHGNRRR